MRKHFFFLPLLLFILIGNAQVIKTDASVLKIKAPDTFKAEFVTTKGNFTVEVYRNWSPLGADRFYQLIKTGYYNNTIVFRVVKDYLVQFGVSEDRPKNIFWQGKNLKDEPVVGSNTDSTICFSRGAPNTRKTSVFINLRNNLTYDTLNAAGVKGFVPFAKVISGMDIVRLFFSDYGNETMKFADSVYFKGNAYLKKKVS
ncbi:MAG: peptidylprolyl isomerase [Chitinophagaceae bacterium]|nr:peptidylprolyl isomerase [Chitinophagaceae bacterium]